MALTYSSPSYVGEKAAGFVADILLEGDTIKKGNITVLPGIKLATKIQEIETNATFQARADAFTASGATVISENTLTPTNLMVQDQVGVSVLLTSWQAQQMKAGANNNEMPQDLGDFLVARKGEIITNQVDELIWQGDTALTGNTIRKWHNGILKLAEADSGVTKFDATNGQLTPTAISVGATTAITVASTATLNVGDKVYCKTFTGADAATLNNLSFTVLEITSATVLVIDAVTTGLTITTGGSTRLKFINASNVLTFLASIIRSTPPQVVNAPDFRLYVPYHIANAYQDANIAAGLSGGTSWERNGELIFKNKVIATQNYFADNTILASRVGNLYFGTDLVSDQNEVMALYMKPVTMDDVYRYSAKFSSSVNYGYASQIKMVRPA